MRVYVQIAGAVVLGLDLAAALGPAPGLLFAGYTIGLGLLLLCLGPLLPDEPDAAAAPRARPDPPRR